MLTVPADDDCGASSSELLSTTSEESAMTPSNSIEYPHDDDDDEALKIVDIPEEKFTDCEMKPSFDHDDNIKSTMDVNGNDDAHPVGSGCNRRRIYTGARFTSFAEFDEAFDEWKRKCFHPFRVASSETLRLPDGSTNDSFKYRYIVYHCAHYGNPRMRGAGKRPNQNYLPCGCRAMLRLNFSWSDNSLRITTLNEQHTDHEISADSYAKFSSKVRRPSPGLTPERPPMVTTTKKPKQPKKEPQRHSTNGSGGGSVRDRVQQLQQHARLSNINNGHTPMSTTTGTLIKTECDQIAKENKEEPAASMLSMNHHRLLPLLQGMLGGMLPPPPPPIPTATPLDLSIATVAPATVTASPPSAPNGLPFDRRSDDERFQEMHATLQAFADHLLHCRGMEFDAKLKQMRLILKFWDGRREFF